MSKELDAIIFGATGFTGRVVTEDAVDYFKDLKWGIAGRNESKLRQLLIDIGKKLKQDLSHIPIVIADIQNELSIVQMAKKCKVVLNCCGPYRFYGEIVVKACIEAGTHHVDVSGEPQFIDKMQLKYNELAQEKGAYVVSACGFESIPAELGVLFVQQQFEGIVNSVESYLETKTLNSTAVEGSSKALVHFGSYESALFASKYFLEMIRYQKQLKQSGNLEVKPKLRLNFLPHKTAISSKYFLPFPVTDRMAVQRSQQLLYDIKQQRPIQYESYVGIGSLALALLLPVYLLFISILTQFNFTLNLLLKYPHIFTMGFVSHEGPSEATMNAQAFKLTFKAKGWSKTQSQSEEPTKQLLAQITGKNPGYGVTSACLLSAAKIILQESDKMPNSGGVLPPGAAFANTSLYREIAWPKYGLKFEIIG